MFTPYLLPTFLRKRNGYTEYSRLLLLLLSAAAHVPGEIDFFKRSATVATAAFVLTTLLQLCPCFALLFLT